MSAGSGTLTGMVCTAISSSHIGTTRAARFGGGNADSRGRRVRLGDRLEILYDPRNPDVSAWFDDLPTETA